MLVLTQESFGEDSGFSQAKTMSANGSCNSRVIGEATLMEGVGSPQLVALRLSTWIGEHDPGFALTFP